MARRFGVELCGLGSSVITVALIVLLQHLAGVSVFGWFAWFVVPVGAILCGFAAAGGYFFGAFVFDRRPTWTLLLSMIAIGLGSYFLIYFVEYRLAIGRSALPERSVIGFWDYMAVAVTSAQYTAHGVVPEGTEVGGFGFLLAALQATGFMVGAGAVYFKLTNLPACERCNRFFRKQYRLMKKFPDDATFARWQYGLDLADPGSAVYADLIRTPFQRRGTVDGCVDVDCRLMACLGCGAQIVRESARTLSGPKWVQLHQYTRDVALPLGVSLREAFHAASTSPMKEPTT